MKIKIKFQIIGIILQKHYHIDILIMTRDVKMGFNPWANLAYHGSKPGWVEKNSFFLKVGW